MTTTKLTDIQCVILSGAAARPDRRVLPAPASVSGHKGRLTMVLGSLLGRGLIAEQPAGPDDPLWREDAEAGRLTLVLTHAGLVALDGGTAYPDEKAMDVVIPAAEPAPTKLSLVVGLLKRPEGASIAEIMAATGWQAHSVRGALSGAVRKKLGLDVTSAKVDEVRRYRIEG